MTVPAGEARPPTGRQRRSKLEELASAWVWIVGAAVLWTAALGLLLGPKGLALLVRRQAYQVLGWAFEVFENIAAVLAIVVSIPAGIVMFVLGRAVLGRVRRSGAGG